MKISRRSFLKAATAIGASLAWVGPARGSRVHWHEPILNEVLKKVLSEQQKKPRAVSRVALNPAPARCSRFTNRCYEVFF
jgi:hypothetical protein